MALARDSGLQARYNMSRENDKGGVEYTVSIVPCCTDNSQLQARVRANVVNQTLRCVNTCFCGTEGEAVIQGGKTVKDNLRAILRYSTCNND